MTREEVIRFLRQLQQVLINNNSWKNVKQVIRESFDMAIEALEGQRWIQCSERLPEELTTVLITDKDGAVFVAEFIAAINGCAEWTTDGVIAWMPLPESYRGEENGTGSI